MQHVFSVGTDDFEPVDYMTMRQNDDKARKSNKKDKSKKKGETIDNKEWKVKKYVPNLLYDYHYGY